MKRMLLATAAMALATTAQAQDSGSSSGGGSGDPILLGVILGFGPQSPLESITPLMADGAELAMSEVNDAGGLLEDRMVEPVRADSTCIDAGAATTAAERLITSDGVTAIMGADCSGVTSAILANVAVPNGVMMISPSATSPALSTAEDNGLFFRTAPSDARQGEVLAQVIMDRGIENVALTYTNNDYGQGLSDSFSQAYESAGGTITTTASHEDGRADYSSEVASLAAAGGEALVVAGYVDQGGLGMIQSSIDSGAFDTFVLPDGMYGQALIDNVGDPLNGSFGTVPGSDSEGSEIFVNLAEEAGFDGTSSYTGESYDAAALIMLAIEASGSTTSSEIATAVMDVANAPGEQILPGDLARALELLANGEDIDYVGATDVELVEGGESAGSFREFTVEDGEFVTDQYR